MNCWPYLLRSWSLPENVLADSHAPHGSLLGLRPLSSLSLWAARVLPLCSSSDSQTDTINSILAWNISGMDHLCFCYVCHLCPMSSILSYVAVSNSGPVSCFLFPFRSMEYVSAWHMEAWVSHPSKQVALHHPHATCLVDEVSGV